MSNGAGKFSTMQFVKTVCFVTVPAPPAPPPMGHVESRGTRLNRNWSAMVCILIEVSVRLPCQVSNVVTVAVPAFAAERRAVAPLQLSAGQQSVGISSPPGAQLQQQTSSSGVRGGGE